MPFKKINPNPKFVYVLDENVKLNQDNCAELVSVIVNFIGISENTFDKLSDNLKSKMKKEYDFYG